MSNRIKVFHVEDYKIVRDGIRYLMSQDDEIEFVGEARNGDELMQKLKTTQVDVLLLDVYLDGMEDLRTMNGFQICHHLVDTYPHIRILAHTVYDDADRVASLLKAGAKGFVSKKSGFEELIAGVKSVYRGQVYVCPETSRRLKNLNRFLLGMENSLRGKDEVFSQREREVLELLSEGKSSREIAEKLFITERTVESHRKNMILKGRVKNTVELIAFASSVGLVKK